MRFGLWMVFDCRVAICQGYVQIVIFRALYCLFIYLYQWWTCLCDVIFASPHCIFVQYGKGLFIQKKVFFCFILNFRRNMWCNLILNGEQHRLQIQSPQFLSANNNLLEKLGILPDILTFRAYIAMNSHDSSALQHKMVCCWIRQCAISWTNEC